MVITAAMKDTVANSWLAAVGGTIYLYDGAIPLGTDATPTGVLLATLYQTTTPTVLDGSITFGSYSGTAAVTGEVGYACMGSPTTGYIYLQAGVINAEFTLNTLTLRVDDPVSGQGTIVVVA